MRSYSQFLTQQCVAGFSFLQLVAGGIEWTSYPPEAEVGKIYKIAWAGVENGV